MTPGDPLLEPDAPPPALAVGSSPTASSSGARSGRLAGGEQERGAPRRRFVLDDQGFDEVPPQYRRFYRRWQGEGDALGPNEALCPVCRIVVRSTRELRPGDRLYCMACLSRLVIERGPAGHLEARVVY